TGYGFSVSPPRRFQMMTTLPNRVSALFADPLQTVLSELQPEFAWNGNGTALRKIAPLSLWEDAQTIYLEMDVPGIALEDLEVAIHKGCLTIKGQRKAAAPAPQFAYQERYFGEFERSVMLDQWVDPTSIEATLRDGVLHLKLSKKPEARRQKVAINYCDGADMERIETSK
ncbi:MAG TPA: Hsp20/alpha crystallin family protein, partial [Planctomycetaceae bacterium]|nr:Hsp20/alpha crystallin family protein [Planctomycetaceae bacterium]